MNLAQLEEKLSYTFKEKTLLEQALTHPSRGYELRRKICDNQRLEFLGDAVLQLALTVRLYHDLPGQPEGELTQFRARLVNRDSLASVASALDLGSYLQLGKGEERNDGRVKTSNLADAMEALIGAIYLDSGFEMAAKWIYEHFKESIQLGKEGETSFNPKGALQELLQSKGLGTPLYEILEETGPDHSKTYKVAVKMGEDVLGVGLGSSKKNAEAEAAHKALINLDDNVSENAVDASEKEIDSSSKESP